VKVRLLRSYLLVTKIIDSEDSHEDENNSQATEKEQWWPNPEDAKVFSSACLHSIHRNTERVAFYV
jgi:hypothetical protein